MGSMGCGQNQLLDLQRKNTLLMQPIFRKHANKEGDQNHPEKLLLTDHFVNKIRNALEPHSRSQSHAGCTYFDSSALSLVLKCKILHIFTYFLFRDSKSIACENPRKGRIKMPILANKVRMWKPIYTKKVNQSINVK